MLYCLKNRFVWLIALIDWLKKKQLHDQLIEQRAQAIHLKLLDQIISEWNLMSLISQVFINE